MTVRNDCRIERSIGGGSVVFDLCFAVGDAVTVEPWLVDYRNHHINGEWYRDFPNNAVMFLGLAGFIDDNERMIKHVARFGVEDPPLPFLDGERGIVHLPLSALDHVLHADGPRRSRWVIRDVSGRQPQFLLTTG